MNKIADLKTLSLHKTQNMDGKRLDNIKAGIEVAIVQKADQRSGVTTEGVVKDILTKSSFHPHGIKVRLTTGKIGRVKEILD